MVWLLAPTFRPFALLLRIPKTGRSFMLH